MCYESLVFVCCLTSQEFKKKGGDEVETKLNIFGKNVILEGSVDEMNCQMN